MDWRTRAGDLTPLIVHTPSAGTRYRRRLAPSPTGLMHLGHARTFWVAQERAKSHCGTLVFRNEDLDCARCRPEFVAAMLEDLRWFGLRWDEGPDCGGPFGPYAQSQRRTLYAAGFDKLRRGGFLYPCTCSRQDVRRALQAPHTGEDESIYPGTCRAKKFDSKGGRSGATRINWRFRVASPGPGPGLIATRYFVVWEAV